MALQDATDKGQNAPANAAGEELEALRTMASHNMRLLKAQIVPLIDAALRASATAALGEAVADHRARWTETALRLIDDTAIAAAAGASGGAMMPVDFRALLKRAADWHGNQIGPVTLDTLPTLMAREAHMRLLAGELMTGLAWTAAQDLKNGLNVGWHVRSGNAVIWFQDGELPAPDEAALKFDGGIRGDRCWSLCRNLMARMDGGLHVSRSGSGRLCLALRFPAEMVVDDQRAVAARETEGLADGGP